MQKAGILLTVTGGIVVLGMALSFYGNQALFDDMARGEGDVMIGEDMVVTIVLESGDADGIYAVQIIERGDEDIRAHVSDPYGMEVASERIEGELFEGRFAIDVDGPYSLIVESDSPDKVKIFGVIGVEPDAGAKSLGFVSLYVLAIGLFGMVGVGIFAIRNRRRS